MKICAMSDLHGHLIPIPKCDVLVIAGDISEFVDINWFYNEFLYHLNENKNKYDMCLIVFGNHDTRLIYEDLKLPNNIKVLTNSGYKYKGIKFWGSPYCLLFHATEEVLKNMYSEMPNDTDVLITHSPAYGKGDTVVNQCYNLGSISLMERIRVVKPKVHIFGHIHTGKKYTKENGTEFYNVSILDENYDVTYKPTIINI